MKKLLISISIAILLFACKDSRDEIFNEVNAVDSKGWNIEDPTRFAVDITDTSSTSDFIVIVRHNTNYQWANLFLFIKTYYPNKDFSRDTIELQLTEPDGKWIGKGGSKKELQFVIHNVKYPQIGRYVFEIVQGMRDNNLEGIESIGLKIIPNS
jgi:gliding motility-associated lipoprotein GldH